MLANWGFWRVIGWLAGVVARLSLRLEAHAWYNDLLWRERYLRID